MKRQNKLLILTGILAVLCAGIFAEKMTEKHYEKIHTIDENILSVAGDSVSSITIHKDKKDLTFSKDGELWTYAEDTAFPVDQEKLNILADRIGNVHASFIIEDVTDFKQYGLSDPEGTVTIQYAGAEDNGSAAGDSAEGETAADAGAAPETKAADATDAGDTTTTTISFGAFSTMDNKRYISVGDNRVFLIDEDLLEDLSSEKDDFLKRDKAWAYDTVSAVDSMGRTNFSLSYEPDANYSYCEDYDYYMTENGEKQPLSTYWVKDYVSHLTGMDLSSYVSYKATAEELSEYGLDQPALSIRISGSMDEKKADKKSAAAVTGADKAEKSGSGDDEESSVQVPDSYTVSFGVTFDDSVEPETEEASEDPENAKDKGTFAAAGDSSEEEQKVYVRFDDSPIIYEVGRSVYDALKKSGYNTLRPREVVSLDWDKVSEIELVVDGKSQLITAKPDQKDKDGKDYIAYYAGEEEVKLDDIKKSIDALSVHEFSEDINYANEEARVILHLQDDKNTELDVQLYRYDGDDCAVTLNGKLLGFLDRKLAVDLKSAEEAVVLNMK